MARMQTLKENPPKHQCSLQLKGSSRESPTMSLNPYWCEWSHSCVWQEGFVSSLQEQALCLKEKPVSKKRLVGWEEAAQPVSSGAKFEWPEGL